MNSWSFLRNKQVASMAHLAHSCTGNRQSVKPVSDRQAHALFLTLPSGPVMDLSVESLNVLWPLTLWLHSCLYFLFTSFLYLLSIPTLESAWFPKNKFLLTFSPATSLPFPTSFPLMAHRVSLPEVGECPENTEAWSKTVPEWTVMTFLLQRLYLNRYLNSLHIVMSELQWCPV